MSFTIGECKDNLAGLLHGGTLNAITGIEMLFERAANTMLSKIDPIDTLRTAPLASTIHDDVYNYALPSDYKRIVDLYPQDERNSLDVASRKFAEPFDLDKAFAEKQISIEASEGAKFLRVNWRSRPGKVLNTLESTTDNGLWEAITGASGVATDTIFKVSGSGSVRFNLTATGGGIKNSTMTEVDLTNEDEIADIFVWVYLPSVSITSIACRFGNDLTANYWTPTAQTTQADGTAFKVGWNLIKFGWNGAVETGTVAPSTIDSFQLTINGSTAINNIRVDNIIFSIGRNFDIKYYSKFIIKNTSGTWITRTTTDSDIVVLDSDAIQIFHLENLIAASQQIEGANQKKDIEWAREELYGTESKMGLYDKYNSEHPGQSQKVATRYYSLGRRVTNWKSTKQ